MNQSIQYRKGLVVALLAASGLAFVSGCDREESKDNAIRAYVAPKDTPGPDPMAAFAATTPGTPHWQPSPEWKQRPAGDQQIAVYSVADNDPGAAVTVAQTGILPLLGNVNRWQGQIGGPTLTEADLPKVLTKLDLPAGPAELIDISSPESTEARKPRMRTVVAIVQNGGKNWYFKLMGMTATVEAQRAKFDEFLRSIRFDDAEDAPPVAAAEGTNPPMPAGHPQITPPAVTPKAAPSAADSSAIPSGLPFRFTMPAGWSVDPAPNPVRVLSLKPGPNAEVAVTMFDPMNRPISEQLNRWRGQVGLPLAQSDNAFNGEAVKVSGVETKLFDLPGPQNRIIAVQLIRGGKEWYFKITGTSDAVGAQKDAFRSFVTSIQF